MFPISFASLLFLIWDIFHTEANQLPSRAKQEGHRGQGPPPILSPNSGIQKFAASVYGKF